MPNSGNKTTSTRFRTRATLARNPNSTNVSVPNTVSSPCPEMSSPGSSVRDTSKTYASFELTELGTRRNDISSHEDEKATNTEETYENNDHELERKENLRKSPVKKQRFTPVIDIPPADAAKRKYVTKATSTTKVNTTTSNAEKRENSISSILMENASTENVTVTNYTEEFREGEYENKQISSGHNRMKGSNKYGEISRKAGNTKSKDLNRDQEVVRTVLQAFGEQVDDCTENFFKENIKFHDLALLTREDLIMLGVTNTKKQKEILDTLKDLPRQSPSYSGAITAGKSRNHNGEILENVRSHLNSMSKGLSATNYKLRVVPSSDAILKENDYASKFVYEALGELKKVTHEIESRLDLLERISKHRIRKPVRQRKGVGLIETTLVVGATIVVVGYYMMKNYY